MKKKILIVDDEEMILEFLDSVFRSKKSYETYLARSGEEALELIEKTRIDLVISDIKMAGMDGIDLLLKIKAKYSNTHVIMMTAYSSPTVKKIALQRGAVHFIKKPFDVYFLLDYIYKLFHRQKDYSGTIQEISLVDVIQMLCLSQSDKLLQVHHDNVDKQAEVYIDNGQIISCTFGEEQGEKAFNSLLDHTHGSFQVIPYTNSPIQNIFKPWNQLLLSKYSEDAEILEEEREAEHINLQFESIEDFSDYFKSQLEDVNSFLIYDYQSKSVINLNGAYNEATTDFIIDILDRDKDISELNINRLEKKHLIKKLNNTCFLKLTGDKKLNYGVASMLIAKHQSEIIELINITHK